MNIDRIRYILEVAKLGSITHAAQNLHITQSALSQAITSVENELGAKIFNRSRDGTDLTLFGQQIIGKANDIHTLYQELKEDAHRWSNEPSGELKIATVPGFMPLFVNILAKFKNDYPAILIEIVEKKGREIINDILNNQCNIGFINIYKDIAIGNELTFETLYRGKFQVCMSRYSSLAYNRILTPQNVLEEKLVLYDSEEVNQFVKKFEKAHGKLTILFKTNNTDAIRAALKNNLAITFVFNHSLKYEPSVLSGENIHLPMSHIDSSLDFGIIRSKQQANSPLANTFLHQFRLELAKADRLPIM
ncbi:LysR family transcriptional regulator [Sporosarcina sp. UB5]|uniref:LysR family transcriptional regulator n=1 Tax=Sporosarcina sp. UB5 TaxID=3047463 RepID=UPI003D7AF962